MYQDLVTLFQAADLVGVSIPTAYRWADDGIISCVEIAGHRYAVKSKLPHVCSATTRRVVVEFPETVDNVADILAKNPRLRLR